MNQNFKTKYGEVSGEAMNEKDNDETYYLTHKTPSGARNLCFTWKNGLKRFYNYSYLVSSEYSPEEGRITLWFTSEKIVIEGIRLGILYSDLIHHIPLNVTCIDQRYNSEVLGTQFIINSITVNPN